MEVEVEVEVVEEGAGAARHARRDGPSSEARSLQKAKEETPSECCLRFDRRFYPAVCFRRLQLRV